MIVSDSADSSFDRVNRVGVAIKSDPGQRHAAFLYRTDAEPVMLLHLGWHHKLYRASFGQKCGPDATYMWADIAELDDENRIYLANYLSLVGGEEPEIPYGLNSEGIEFDPLTGELKPPPAGRGVTCATFILAVLRATAHVVVDLTDWPMDRPGDKEWQTMIVQALESHYPAHAEAVKRDISCVRLRPEEIIGASATEGWTHSFEQAESAGLQVIDDLRMSGKPI